LDLKAYLTNLYKKNQNRHIKGYGENRKCIRQELYDFYHCKTFFNFAAYIKFKKLDEKFLNNFSSNQKSSTQRF